MSLSAQRGSSPDPNSGVARDRIDVLGIPVDRLDRAAVIAMMRRYLADPWDGRCRQIVTLNPEYVMAARRDPAFAGSIAAADLIVADGVGVALLARHLGEGDEPARVTGVDLVETLAALGDDVAAPIFLLGGGEGVAAAAAAALVRRYPGCRIAGSWSGGSAAVGDDRAAIERLRGRGARAVLVAYGAPGQVHWIARNQRELSEMGVRLAIGVGGTLDYLAGRVPRAPAPIRAVGLEWLYRLIRQPWRWRRQRVLPGFAFLGLLSWLWRRGNRPSRWARRIDTVGSSQPVIEPNTTPPGDDQVTGSVLPPPPVPAENAPVEPPAGSDLAPEGDRLGRTPPPID